MQVLANAMVIMILQYTSVSNQQAVISSYIYINGISMKLEKQISDQIKMAHKIADTMTDCINSKELDAT